MEKLMNIITSLVALVFAGRKSETDLKQAVADRDKIIADLHAAIDGNAANDAALVQAKADALAAQKTAEDNLAALQAQIDDTTTKATALAATLTADPTIPIVVDASTGDVTHTDSQGVPLDPQPAQ